MRIRVPSRQHVERSELGDVEGIATGEVGWARWFPVGTICRPSRYIGVHAARREVVLLTTFRKSGDAVATPVWIAPLPDGGAGFTTDADVGKVKRIRNTPRVTLQACSATGKVKPGAEVVEAKATVLLGADAGPIRNAIRSKYWVMVPLLGVLAFFARLVRRKPAAEECAIQLTFE